MRTRAAVALLFAFALLLGTSATLHASFERHYTVWYSCIISPMPTDPVGEWDVDCDGVWTGWGWEPGHSCTRSDVTFGAYCGPDIQQNPSLSSSQAAARSARPAPACMGR